MKDQFKSLFLVAAILLISHATAFATAGFCCPVIFRISQTMDDPYKEWDPESMRKPGKPITGIIDSENGIQIPGLDKSQVVSYELYSEGICLGSWCDETDFISQLSEQDGLVEIRINLQDYCLRGYMELPL